MKIECIKEKLEEAVRYTEKITGKNLSLPVLNCLLLVAKGGKLKISSTNLDVAVEISLPAKIYTEGALAVPGNVLLSHVSSLKEDKKISLEEKEKNLLLTSSLTKSVIKTYPHDDFPIIPKVSSEKHFFVDSKKLVSGLRSVFFSASVSSMKPELSSVYVYLDKNELVFVATDSFRLSEKKIKQEKVEDLEGVLIPFKNAQEIVRVFSETDDSVKVNLSDNQISFVYEGLYITSRLVDGSFPDYKQIIPKEFQTEVVLLKQDLADALKMSNIFSDNFSQVTLFVSNKKNTLELLTQNQDVGENRSIIKCRTEGEDLDVSFNHKYLAEALQSIDFDSLVLKFAGKNKPMVMEGVGDRSFMYLVMPMNK